MSKDIVSYVEIGNIEGSVSYDRIGNILIGMDILKKLETHIGTTATGDTVLLACPKDKVTYDYWDKLGNLYDLRNDI
ncbi:MAG: hypothetical protein IKQ71_07470 [Lachnospiraceae bacterium]|nr:hypothetical protein [Lachnospiraceae bacterium]